MPRLSLSERVNVTALAADRSLRRLVSRVLYSPFLRWRYGSAYADQLLIVPQDLRTADPSLWREFRLGQFGLAGSCVELEGNSPFELTPPSAGWLRSLHGFAWLRHLEATREDEAREAARSLALEWTLRFRSGTGVPWRPEVLGRRLISWITHAGLLLDGADPKTYDALAASLGFQLVRLSATWREAPAGEARLLALIAVVLANLSVAGHDRQLREAERALTDELDRQILPDGGHVSRNPAVLLDLVLDLLPLSQCFKARDLEPPEGLSKHIPNMLSMLRFMRLGDGLLARFNGMSIASPAGLATVLAYDDTTKPPVMKRAASSGYSRLERGDTIVIADVAPPPQLQLAGNAHAGCLSFEMSVGRTLLLVNGGAPGPADAEWRAKSRGTASHNTLSIGDKSSSKLVRHALLEDLVGAAPIRFPDNVSSQIEESNGSLLLTAQHDGYVRRWGLMHSRILILSQNGQKLTGTDRITGSTGVVRLKRDLPFALRFHLHPEVEAQTDEKTGKIELFLPDGSVWWFIAPADMLTLEDSIYFADSAGPCRSTQIVIRGATFGETEINWALESAVS